MKIAGVQHEFSTIPGVKEDVTEIILNVKSIIPKLHTNGPKTVYIEASGEGVVTAGDIKPDADEQFAQFEGRYFSTPKKMGAQTAEANINAGIAAAKQINAFFADGCTKFQVNK